MKYSCAMQQLARLRTMKYSHAVNTDKTYSTGVMPPAIKQNLIPLANSKNMKYSSETSNVVQQTTGLAKSYSKSKI